MIGVEISSNLRIGDSHFAFCALHLHVHNSAGSAFRQDKLKSCIYAVVMWSRIDFVAEFEPPHSRSDLDHDPSHVISEDERQAIRQDELELSIPDLRIQRIYTSGVHPNQDVVLA